MSEKIYIFDTTLRDGEQVPGAKLIRSEKVRLAQKLEDLGVDIIEAGFPISSPEDFAAVQEVARTIKNSTVCGLARGLDLDIESAARAVESANKSRIHTFISVSDIHINHQMRKSREQVLEMVYKAVSKAAQYADDVEFSPMDASRADMEYMVKFVQTAIDAGAKTINIPDTVGYALPEEWGAQVKQLVEAIPAFKKDVILSMHTHNDLGLATANALAGVVNGARQIECTINGVGERAGNCSLEEVVMAIKKRYDGRFHTDVNHGKIFETSRITSEVMGIPVQPNKAIVGANAFAHSSGIHQDGILKHRENFEIMSPAEVGADDSTLIVLTARSGRAAILHRLKELGFVIEKSDLDDIYKIFLQIADSKKEMRDEDLKEMMKQFESAKA